MIKSTREILTRAKATIPTHRQWCKDKMVTDDDHRRCLYGACLMGQYNTCLGVDSLQPRARKLLLTSIAKLFPDRYTDSIAEFNDHLKTRHADVIKVLDHAIKLSKKGK